MCMCMKGSWVGGYMCMWVYVWYVCACDICVHVGCVCGSDGVGIWWYVCVWCVYVVLVCVYVCGMCVWYVCMVVCIQCIYMVMYVWYVCMVVCVCACVVYVWCVCMWWYVCVCGCSMCVSVWCVCCAGVCVYGGMCVCVFVVVCGYVVVVCVCVVCVYVLGSVCVWYRYAHTPSLPITQCGHGHGRVRCEGCPELMAMLEWNRRNKREGTVVG